MSEDTQTKDIVASHMALPGDATRDFHEHMSRGRVSKFPVFSSECIECDCLAFDEVAYEDDLSLRSRVLCRLSMLLGCQVANGSWGMSSAALNSGVDATSLKEDVYQASPFRKVKSKVFIRRGVILPLDSVIATASDTESQCEGGERHGWICAGVTMDAVAPAVPTSPLVRYELLWRLLHARQPDDRGTFRCAHFASRRHKGDAKRSYVVILQSTSGMETATSSSSLS